MNYNKDIIVYRGEGIDNKSTSYIWVSPNEDFAKEYGKISKYVLPTSLNLLDANTNTFEELVLSYQELTNEGGDVEEYKYEPPIKFMNFLKQENYDGFENDDNILIFNKNNLKNFENVMNENKQPKIFSYTAYRLPTKEDLIDINNHNLTAKEIVDGFSFTIIGKGIQSPNKTKDIIKSIEMLVLAYPENNEYKKALNMVKNNINETTDKKDSIKMDIPLLIRTYELAREDIKSDADLHRMVERLLKLKDKGTLTMDDYDFIANFKKALKNINESIKLDIEKGDILLSGKFRNKKVVVKTIGTDEHGSPTVNGKSILNVRIEKLMKGNKKDKLKESDNIIKTLLREELENKFAIEVKGREAGVLQLKPIPQLGNDAVEIVNIKIDTKDFKGIKVAIDAVHSIFKQSHDINRVVVAPKEESKDFWNKVGFNRLNNDYMFIMRGH